MEKPLFIPLNREYFEQFEAGTKTVEYRVYGSRWNEDTCRVGREAVLSLGYGKDNRITGTVKSFNTCRADKCKAKKDFYKIYGFDPFKMVAEIEIELKDC